MTGGSEWWWWDLIPAALGAILGAAAAAIPAYLLADRASKDTLKRDQDARLEHQKALAYRLLVKLQGLANSTGNVTRTIEEMIVAADRAGHRNMATWQKVRPIAGLPSEAREFDAEELALLVASDDLDMMNRLSLLVERHAATLAQLRVYERERGGFHAQFPPAAAAGVHGTILFHGEPPPLAVIAAAALEDMITHTRRAAAADAQLANELAERLGPIMRRLLDDHRFPLLQPVPLPAAR